MISLPLLISLAMLVCLGRGSASQPEFNLERANRYWYYFVATLCESSKLESWNVGIISERYPNFTNVHVIHNSTGEAMAYVAYDPAEDSIYAVFRGTINSVKNWIDDGDIIMAQYPECLDCKVHKGFYDHYLDLKAGVIANLTSLLQSFPTASIRIIGHSMGATGATHLAIDVKKIFGSFDSLYTYGSPRVGNKAFSDWWNQQMKGIFNVRITHKHDPVPHLPPRFLGFIHVSTEYFYPSDDLEAWVVCAPYVEDDRCSNQYYFDINENDHITYMNENCNDLSAECKKKGFLMK